MRNLRNIIARSPALIRSHLLISLVVLSAIICLLPLNSSALIGIKTGDSPKEIVLEDLNGSSVAILKNYGNKPVIIVFWELTMSEAFLDYSLDVLRYLNKNYEKYHEKHGLEIFGIYTPEEEKVIPVSEMEKVKNLVKINKIKFPILIDRGFKVFREYGVIALPTTIMIEKTGKIKFIYPSFPLAALPQFEKQIMGLVGLAKVEQKKSAKMKDSVSHAIRLYNYALQMYRKGLLEQAHSPLKKSLELDVNFTWSHNLMGVILWKRGDFEGAKGEFNYAIKLNKDNGPAHFNYAVLLFESERYDESEQYFQKAISLEQDLAEGYYVLGMLYKKTGREDDALKSLGKALELFEKRKRTESLKIVAPSAYHRVSTLYELSELYSKKGNERKALEMLRKAANIVLGHGAVSGGVQMKSKDLMIYE